MTRRRFLRLGVGGSVAGLAGCSGSEAESPSTTSTEEESVFSSVGVDGDFLVVEVAGSDALSKVNLIAPDGTLYGAERIQSGVRTVRFRLIELKLSQSSHYTLGEYELVAVAGGDSIESKTVDLRPDLRIREIEQYQNENDYAAKTRLAIVIENVGTAPTWIYDIAYRDAPYQDANDDLSPHRAIPNLKEPTEIENLILRPNTSRKYVSSEQPIHFGKEEQIECSDSFDMTLLLGVGTGDSAKWGVQITVRGQAESLGRFRGYSCSQVSADILDPTSQEQDEEGVRGS